MKTTLFAVLACCLLGLPLTTLALSAGEAIQQSRELAAAKKYVAALSVLQEAATQAPDDFELKLAIIRVLGWQGNYQLATSQLDALGSSANESIDVLLLRANLAYYQGQYAGAENYWRQVTRQEPENMDAKAGLTRIHDIRSAPAKPVPLSWQADIGFEQSRFSRVERPDWKQGFIQLSHSFNARKSSVYGKLSRYEQFSRINSEIELGAAHQFSPSLNAYAFVAQSPQADFRPRSRLSTGGALKVMDTAKRVLWLSIDSRYDAYSATRIVNFSPGLRFEPFAGWSLAARRIIIQQQDQGTLYGKDYRIDGSVTDSLRFYVGYANTSEYEETKNVPTITYFTGMSLDISPENTLRYGYSRDERQNSYLRAVYNVSLSHRF